MKILRIDHIALCVPEIEPALQQWQATLGRLLGPREYVPTQLTEAAFVLTPAEGEACVELIAPKPRGENLGLEKFLDKRGGLHHIAFAVENIQSALDGSRPSGAYRFWIRIHDRARRGHQVVFLHPKALGGVLVELVSG